MFGSCKKVPPTSHSAIRLSVFCGAPCLLELVTRRPGACADDDEM